MKNITPNFHPSFQPEITIVRKYKGVTVCNRYYALSFIEYIGFITFYPNPYVQRRQTLLQPLSELLINTASRRNYMYIIYNMDKRIETT